MLLVWGQRPENENHEALQQWIDSDDAWELYQRLIKDVQREQPFEQLALTMAALMSFRRLRPDHDDDRTGPVSQSFVGDMHACVSGLPLRHSGRVMEAMMFPLIRLVREKQFVDLAIFLATTLDRDEPPLHLLDGLSDEYIRWRMTRLSHTSAMKIVDAELSALQLCLLCDSLSIGSDQNRAVSRYPRNLRCLKFAHNRRCIDNLAYPGSCQDPTSDCHDFFRVRDVDTVDDAVLVSLLNNDQVTKEVHEWTYVDAANLK